MSLSNKLDQARNSFLHNWERSRKVEANNLQGYFDELSEILKEVREKSAEAERIIEARKTLDRHLAETALALENAKSRILELEAANIKLQGIAGVREHIEREIAVKKAELDALEGQLVNNPE